MTGRRTDWDRLTERELGVLQQAARGLTCLESGAETHHTQQTVKFHRKHIIRKLRARNITHAVALAYEQGILGVGIDEPGLRSVA